MNIKNLDVLVIGAGPAGCSVAKFLAENGFKVEIIEKAIIGSKGRYKACGGAIAWELVEEIKLPEELISRPIESLELHHTDGDVFTKNGKGAVVWRSQFDKFLSDLALNAGTIIHENESPEKVIQLDNGNYQVITKKNNYTAKYLIAADGVTSKTLKLLNWPDFSKGSLVLTITHEMHSSKSTIEKLLGKDKVHLFFGIKDLIPLGYAWLFPKKDFITVGWGNCLEKIKNTRKEFQKFLQLQFVKKAITNAKTEIYKAHLIPVGLRTILSQNNVIAVGDSAGFVDPISGKGIPYAMIGGVIAYEVIKKVEDKNKTSQDLDKLYKKRLNSKFLLILQEKRKLREKIFESDENLKKYLALWEKYRSSEIILKKLF
jgi:geranylgeranyl reductase family protein